MSTQTEMRSCTRCARPFPVPLTGFGRNRRKCFTCAPKQVFAPVDPSAAPVDSSEPKFTSDMESFPPPRAVESMPEYKGEFQKEAESILGEFPECDRSKRVAALAIAKALDSSDITGAQIGGLVTKWLAIMENIKEETPVEPDKADDLAGTIARKLGTR